MKHQCLSEPLPLFALFVFLCVTRSLRLLHCSINRPFLQLSNFPFSFCAPSFPFHVLFSLHLISQDLSDVVQFISTYFDSSHFNSIQSITLTFMQNRFSRDLTFLLRSLCHYNSLSHDSDKTKREFIEKRIFTASEIRGLGKDLNIYSDKGTLTKPSFGRYFSKFGT